jgi:hypothetical protein
MPIRPRPCGVVTGVLAGLACLASIAPPARAVMDINDRGPTLNAGNYTMRVTNIGVLGNAFYDQGLSFDASFEYPKGSGLELLKHADLWVGGLDVNGQPRVSGGPMLEWRPQLDPFYHVRVGWKGRAGSRRGVDDDGDGRIDEERFNGRDDDGDGEIDEDLAFPSDEVTASEYTDDQPAAINYGYPNGETHVPFGLDVYEEDYAWTLPGYDGIAGIQYVITNHSGREIQGLYVGLLADLDVRLRNDPQGQLNDVVTTRSFGRTFSEGTQHFTVGGIPAAQTCFSHAGQTVPVVMDGQPGTTLPVIAVVGMGHTTDPLALLDPPQAKAAARAPGRESFRYSVFRQDLPPGQGGLPVVDTDRYAALAGTYPTNPRLDVPGDQAVLVSCGPFPTLATGQSIEFAVAFCAAPSLDSLPTTMGNAAYLYHGFAQNRLRDTTGTEWYIGETGKNGHEVCVEPPAGVSFDMDPHCPPAVAAAYMNNLDIPVMPVHYQHGQCVWTDADCDLCTGLNGFETRIHWLDPGSAPPAPGYHVAPGDHAVAVAWDNQPEILVKAGLAGGGGYTFDGYRLYRLSDWTRQSPLPPPDRWEQIASFGPDSLNGEAPLAAVTDTTVPYDFIRYGQKHYPIGRYRLTDPNVLNGFSYVYLVTAVASRVVQVGGALGQTRTDRVESPLAASIDSIVVPQITPATAAGRVWVVPNPYRASAPWERPAVPGDVFTRHVDFMGLPRAPCVIKIWTLAGDLVARLDHDGTGGSGEAAWNLISRNGQDIESGVYLFTVDSKEGHQIGKFVIIR